MSKKKNPNSWKGRGEAYKNTKRAPIEDAPIPYVKKKKKENKRSKHKHIYIPAIYHNSYSGFNSNGKKTEYITCGSHCKICGRVKNMRFMWFNSEDRIEQFKLDYPDYVEVYLPEEWDYFKNKSIPL